MSNNIFQKASLLEMKNITKTFPGVRALDNVTLRLEKGEVLALLGENGAGKSTLIKVLGGAYSVDSGEIFIENRLTKRIWDAVKQESFEQAAALRDQLNALKKSLSKQSIIKIEDSEIQKNDH